MTTPPVLLPYQTTWVGDTSQVKVWEKSRRIGASWAEAGDDAFYAASRSGQDAWYIGYNKDMARQFIEDCAFWARHYQLAAAEWEEDVFAGEGLEGRDILVYRIKFASGNEVVALSSRPAELRGKQGRVIIDEAAFHPDLPGLIKAAMALLMWGYPERILPVDAAAAEKLKKRTLTNLYNERPTWLDNAHRDLDAAVAAAYGWPADIADEEALARLLALNQERAARQ